MVVWPLQPLTATPTPETSRAVGQASTMILIVALVGIVLICWVLLLILRRRTHANDPRRVRAGPHQQPDAWLESAKRVALEDDDQIPREPGSA
jgi:hypothetical protein